MIQRELNVRLIVQSSPWHWMPPLLAEPS